MTKTKIWKLHLNIAVLVIAAFFIVPPYVSCQWLDGRIGQAQSKPVTEIWQDWPGNFGFPIDAALLGDGPAKGKAFFFKDDQFIRFDWQTGRVEPGYPKSIWGNWHGFPAAFCRDIDAALSADGPFKGKAYFFKGDQYIRYDWATLRVDNGYPKSISVTWKRWPMEFNEGIDAALSGSGRFSGKAYFFKGNQYIRYDWEKDKVDKGYPRSIAESWQGWPADFYEQIDAALPGDGPFRNKAFFFKENRYIRYDWEQDRVDPGFPKAIYPIMERMERERGLSRYVKNRQDEIFESGLSGNKVFFFSGDQYVRYDWETDSADAGYPRLIEDSWQGWPEGFIPIDAVVLGEGPFKGKAYFFKGSQYFRFDMLQKRVEPGYPKIIAGRWDGWPMDFNRGIDAAVSGAGPFKGKAYFFKGDQYIRYDWETDRIDPGYPKNISDGWPGWPLAFTEGIDAAVSGSGSFAGKAYFFRGNQYIRYDWEKDKTDRGYPKRIEGNWPGLPDYFLEGIDAALEGGNEVN
ncbi:MAG: hypothetical protein QG657_1463 [Acidobacteriota bacterium]|nr:hypothetical protein [Acidobacteriota bacterium]